VIGVLTQRVISALCSIFLIVAIFGLVVYYSLNQKREVQHVLTRMPQKDKQCLTDFFEELIRCHCFGYTLFGDKPVVFTSYFIRPLLRDIVFEDKSGIVLRNGEKIWKAYERDFQIKDFILKFHTQGDIRYIVLVNKQLLAKKIEEHKEYISQVIGRAVDAQVFLNQLENEENNLFDMLQQHDGLLGIVLGFGKQNSVNFQRYVELENALYNYVGFPYKTAYKEELVNQSVAQKISLMMNRQCKKIHAKRIMPTQGFSSITEEYNDLQSKLQGVQQTCLLQKVCFPGFRADLDSTETKELLDSFRRTRIEIGKVYEKGDFLEIIINKLHGKQ
jgi:hypothetical protein